MQKQFQSKDRQHAANTIQNAQQDHAPLNPVMLQRAVEDPSQETLTTDATLQLQRTHGNRFVQGLMVQAKMSVTPAGDQYEQEADSMADQVMQQMSAGPVQRAEEDELQMKRIQRAEEDELQLSRIQREGEEDEIALSRIQRAEEDELQLSRIQREGEEDELQLSRIQRAEEDELQMKRIQRVGGEAGFDVSSDVEAGIQSQRGGGQPLPDNVRGSMEGAFGADFGNVRVHTGAESDTLNRSVQARAFTTGSDIFFREGEYNPDSSDGQRLIAHELTHTIQQGAVQQKRDE
jgi:hypothetical protein